MTDMGAHQFGTNFPAVGNRYDPSLPTWAQNGSGTVTEISSGTTISSAALAGGAGSYGGTPASNLAEPWSGGTVVLFNSVPYLICMGGGHNDGSWNGHVGFGPLTGTGSDTPIWSTVFPASSTGSVVANSATYSDGRQSSNHTYNNLVAVGQYHYTLYGGGAWGGSAPETDRVFRVDYGTGGAPAETELSPPNNPGVSGFGCSTAYNNKLYFMGPYNRFDRLRIYDIASNTWSSESNSDIAITDYPAMAADPGRGRILMVGGNGAYLWDAATLSRQSVNVPGGYDNCLEFDTTRDAFVTLNGGSSTIYELSGGNPTGSWTTRSYSGSTPASGVPAGTYGRFRYVPQLGGCLIVPSSSSNVWFFKS